MKWKKLLSGVLTGALLFTSLTPVSFAQETEPAREARSGEPVPVAEYKFEDNLNNSMSENDAAAAVVTKLGAYTGTPTYVEGRRAGSKAVKLGDFGLQLNKKNLGKNFTVSAWYKADSTLAENQNLMFLGHHNPEKWIGISGNKNNTDQLKVWTSEGTEGAEFYRWITLNNPNLPAGEWHCLTLTQSEDDNTVKTYIDGELFNTSRGAYALDGANQDVYIGVNNWDAEFTGAVDDVKVYDRTLSDAEVYNYCYDVKISDQAIETYDFNDFQAAADAASLTDGTRNVSLVKVGTGTAPSLADDAARGKVLKTVSQGTQDDGLNNIGYAQLPSNPFEGKSTDNGLTLNFWANTQGSAGGGKCMIDFEVAPATTGRAGTFAFNQLMVYWNTTDQDGAFTDFDVKGLGLGTANTWKMVTMTVTKDGITFYSNGKKISHTVSSGTEDYATMINELAGDSEYAPEDGTKVRLGASMATYWTGAGALLDDISFFGKELSASEVAQLYDETATAAPATAIAISSDETTLNIDKTAQLNVSLTPADATGLSKLSWKSSDEKVATVNREGVVTALAEGEAVITASIGDIVSNELTIKVEKVADIKELESGYYLAVYTTTTPFYAPAANVDQETQSVYFAVSKDGKTFDVLNNGGGVIFSKNTQGTLKITEPKVFKANGKFTVIARDADKSKGYHEFTSTDGVHFYDDTLTSTPSQTSAVLDAASFKFMLDGKNLVETDKNLVVGNAIALTKAEYTYIVNKLGTVLNNGLKDLKDKDIEPGTTLTEKDLAESYPTATATYTDGSTQDFNIDWSGALDGVDLSKEGTYEVTGKVVQTKYLNNLKELNGSKLPEDDPDNANEDFPSNYDPDTKTVYYDETKFVEGMADPHIYWDEETQYYYMTGSYFPEPMDAMDNGTEKLEQYDRVVLRRGRTLEELQDRSKQVTLWKVGNQGYENNAGQNVDRGYRYIWAPEIHRVGDYWVVYFTESQTTNLFGIYCHALVLPGDQDPYETALTSGNEASQWEDYQMRGGSGLTNAIKNSFCLDMTYFEDEKNGESYVVWASTAYGPSSLYMAKVNVEKPWELTSDIMKLTAPDYGWENIRYVVNEGATVLQRDGNIYLCYSSSGTGSEYAIGMMTAKAGTDLLKNESWTKSPYPLLTSRDVDGEEGPGHNSFTVDKDGNAIFVYHARPTSHNYQMCGWDGSKSSYNGEPLNDPCRHARLKRVHWAADGTPILKMTYEDELLEENATITLKINVKKGASGVDTTDLEAALAGAFSDDYADVFTADSWKVYKDAVEAAKKVLADKNATQKEIDDATAAVAAALDGLKIENYPFVDVPQDAWFFDTVYYNFFAGTMTGKDKTHFAPMEGIVRAQFAVILHRLSGKPEAAYAPTFPDVEDGIWYTDAIMWASSKDVGVVTGYTDEGVFKPAKDISREEMAVMMYRYAKLINTGDTDERADLSSFKDAANVSGFAKDAMEWAVATGLITGITEEGNTTPTLLNPQGTSMRAQCAAVIERFIEAYAE